MTDRSEWEGRVGRKWAEEWRRTDRSFAALTDRLVGRISGCSPERILDVGCGAGELSLALARANPAASVIGVDISAELISVAQERCGRLGNAAFVHGDAATWSGAGFAPDTVVSRHGVMFFADPRAAFGHLRSAAAPSAHLVFSCFRARSENAWATQLAALLPGEPEIASDPYAPGPFAFADRVHVARILDDAGWRDIGFEAFDFSYVAGSGERPVDDALSYFLAIGPAARAAAALDRSGRADFEERLRIFLSGIEHGGKVALPAAAWIVSARKG